MDAREGQTRIVVDGRWAIKSRPVYPPRLTYYRLLMVYPFLFIPSPRCFAPLLFLARALAVYFQSPLDVLSDAALEPFNSNS